MSPHIEITETGYWFVCEQEEMNKNPRYLTLVPSSSSFPRPVSPAPTPPFPTHASAGPKVVYPRSRCCGCNISSSAKTATRTCYSCPKRGRVFDPGVLFFVPRLFYLPAQLPKKEGDFGNENGSLSQQTSRYSKHYSTRECCYGNNGQNRWKQRSSRDHPACFIALISE